MEVARNETPGGLSVPQRWVSGKLSLGDSAALASVLAVPPARWPPEPLALHLQNSGRGWEGVCVSSPGRFAGRSESLHGARSTLDTEGTLRRQKLVLPVAERLQPGT